jgi:hypothetical protein
MASLIQHLFTAPSESGHRGVSVRPRQPGILAISADMCFYAKVLNAAGSLGWRTTWARGLNRAIDSYAAESTPIAIYDVSLPNSVWASAFDRLSSIPNPPRILLASKHIDEELWRNVLQKRGYDVLLRSAGSAEFARMLHFAWLSLQPPDREMRH